MRINSINTIFLNTSRANFLEGVQNKNARINQINLPKRNCCDCVSFSGNSNTIGSFDLPMAKTQNVERASELGIGIMNLLEKKVQFSEVEDFIKSEMPFVDIADMDTYRKRMNDPAISHCAYSVYDFDDDFNRLDNTIYIDFLLFSANKNPNHAFQKNLSLVRTIAHESTHALQYESDEYNNFMSDIAGGSGEKAKQLESIAGAIFQFFEQDFLSAHVRPFVDNTEMRNSREYGFTIPREIKMSRGIFLQKNKLRGFDSFKNIVNDEFDDIFSYIVSAVESGSAITDEGIDNLIKESVKTKEGKEKLKRDIKAICQDKAKREQEAYTTESELARSVMKTDSRLNLDIFPIYYELLSEALSED